MFLQIPLSIGGYPAGLRNSSGNAHLIGGIAPLVRPTSTPQVDPRGGIGARAGHAPGDAVGTRDNAFGRSPHSPGAPELPGTGTQSSRPVPPPQGLLAIGMDGIEALQGIKTETSDHKTEKEPAPGELSDEEDALVKELARTDQEVRRHERAHAAAGGAHAGAPSYSYQQGPDGQRYAVNGEVSIDISPVQGDPGATLQKMRQVKAAALAPAQPSGQDRSVAAAADAISQQAQAELTAEVAEKTKVAEETRAAEEIKVEDKGQSIPESNGPGQGPSDPATIGQTSQNQPGSFNSFGGNPDRPPRDIPPGSFTDISV